MQTCNGAADGDGGGEGPKVVAGTAAGAAVLGEFGGFVIGGDQDVGKALVVAEEDIEARFQALDEIGFEEEGLGLRLGAHELHRDGGHDHALDAHGEAFGAGVIGNARL